MELSRRNRSLLAALACASALAACAAPPAAAATPRAHSSIVGGGPADPAQWPYAVAIFRKGHMHCSGSVIGPTKVLTAGPLRRRLQPRQLPGDHRPTEPARRGRGQIDRSDLGQGPSRFRADRPARRGGAQPRAADERDADRAGDARAERRDHGAPAPSCGWPATGRPTRSGRTSRAFLKTTIERSRTDRRCLKAYTRDLYAPESMICALGAQPEAPGRFKIHTSACSGDSGGPLVADTPDGPGRGRHRLLRRRALRAAGGADGLLEGLVEPRLHQRP